MKEIKTISEGANYTAVNIGLLDQLNDYELTHPKTGKKIEGKVFLQEATKATGTEISVTTLMPHTEIPYFHIHFENEETYIILKGSGDFQVDHTCFPVTEGSVVRVATKGNRCIRNTSDQPMVYMVIQSQQESLKQASSKDGERVPEAWSK